MGWRELLEHPLIKQKEEEPIGDRFLVQNDLQLPNVNLDIKMDPTVRFSVDKDKPSNYEDHRFGDRFAPRANKVEDMGEKPVVDNQ